MTRKERKTLAQELARKAIQQALKGNLAALKEIADRTEGKSVQPLSHSGLDSEPIAFHVNLGRDPNEQVSLVSSSPDKVGRARKLLTEDDINAMKLRALHGITTGQQVELDEETIQRLKASGYVQ